MTAVAWLGCASPGALRGRLNSLIAEQKYADAGSLIEKSKTKTYGPKNALLYYMDLGYMQHLAGDYKASNASFEQAKKISADLITKSVTTEAGTFLTNDNLRPYAGESFELAMIRVFAALNYALLGDDNEAVVEARQVNQLLTKLETDFGGSNVYREDPFARYLSGMLYENAGQINDAHVSYMKALQAYSDGQKTYAVPPPEELIKDALRTARALSFDERVRELQKRWPATAVPAPLPKDAGEVVIVHYAGSAPRKVDSFFEIGLAAGWVYVDAQQPSTEEAGQVEQANAIMRSLVATQLVRMAFPKYAPVPYRIDKMTARLKDSDVPHASVLADDLGRVAEKSLADRVGRVRAKTIARAVVKYVLAHKIAANVEKKNGEGAGWLIQSILQSAAALTELSDKRGWQGLPDKIYLTRLVVPAGEQRVELDFQDAQGASVRKELRQITVKPGIKNFLIARTAQ